MSHHSSLCCPSANGCPCHPSCCDNNRYSFTPFHTCHLSCRNHSCHFTDWGLSCSSPATPTAQHRNLSQEKPKSTQDPQSPINPTNQRLSSSRIPLQILHQIQTVTLILEPSSSSDEDEWGGHSSNHYTIGLTPDCPTVTVHAGKR